MKTLLSMAKHPQRSTLDSKTKMFRSRLALLYVCFASSVHAGESESPPAPASPTDSELDALDIEETVTAPREAASAAGLMDPHAYPDSSEGSEDDDGETGGQAMGGGGGDPMCDKDGGDPGCDEDQDELDREAREEEETKARQKYADFLQGCPHTYELILTKSQYWRPFGEWELWDGFSVNDIFDLQFESDPQGRTLGDWIPSLPRWPKSLPSLPNIGSWIDIVEHASLRKYRPGGGGVKHMCEWRHRGWFSWDFMRMGHTHRGRCDLHGTDGRKAARRVRGRTSRGKGRTLLHSENSVFSPFDGLAIAMVEDGYSDRAGPKVDKARLFRFEKQNFFSRGSSLPDQYHLFVGNLTTGTTEPPGLMQTRVYEQVVHWWETLVSLIKQGNASNPAARLRNLPSHPEEQRRKDSEKVPYELEINLARLDHFELYHSGEHKYEVKGVGRLEHGGGAEGTADYRDPSLFDPVFNWCLQLPKHRAAEADELALLLGNFLTTKLSMWTDMGEAESEL